MRPRLSHFRLRDLATEALEGMLQRRGRTLLTGLGVVLGVGAFVAVLGLTSTATGQISQRFTALVATEVTVEDRTLNDLTGLSTAFTHDAEQRVKVINGVSQTGVYWTVRKDRVGTVTGVPLPGDRGAEGTSVVAASPGLLEAVHARMQIGRAFDEFHDSRADHVVVLGGGAARRLGITRIDTQPVIFLGGIPMSVTGIIDDVKRRPELLTAVIVPRRTAEALWGQPDDPGSPPRMIIDTQLGAAQVVSAQVAVALRPDAPEAFSVIAPADPSKLRDGVSADLSTLFLLLAGVCLVIGAVGIANTTLVAVLERVPEIGLRRALGARRSHVAAQFLTESGVLGTLGGLVGTGIGVTVVVIVAVTKQWTPLMEPWIVFTAPFVGSVTGLSAGAYPAIRASRIEPVDALRR